MTLPDWVKQNIAKLPDNFSGQIVIECMTGGATRADIKVIVHPPKDEESRRHALSV